MRVSVTGAWGGGGICADVRNILHHGGLNIAPLRVRVLCHALMDWKGAGQISSSGDTAAGGVNTALEQGKDVYIPSLGRGNGKSGTAGDINLHKPSQKTVTQYIATRPIMDLCLATECRPGERVLTL